jgi:polynucleotide 5'-kinase involved in rRNA processing
MMLQGEFFGNTMLSFQKTRLATFIRFIYQKIIIIPFCSKVMTFYFIFVITLLQKNNQMLTQENALKFLRHRPAISVAAVEKQASIPSGTIAQALSKGRQLSEKHLVALDGVLRDYGYRDDLYQKARVVSVINHKGGVGKTTTVCSLGEALANKGFKVLMVDLDPQGNLSQILV